MFSKKTVQTLCILLLASTALLMGQPAQVHAMSDWILQWEDEFDGSGGADSASWLYDIGMGIWGTGEIEMMTDSLDNVYQSSGYLHIKPIHTGSVPTEGWTSGRIKTVRDDFQPPAGGIMAVEASIQLPNVSGAQAQGYWPAFWMLGAPLRTGGSWPSVGEIDVMENINGTNTAYGTFHCGIFPGGPCNEGSGIGGSTDGGTPSLQAGFHTYRMEFDKSTSPEELRWYLDGNQFFSVTANQVDAATWENATDHGFFIILNVAIGGNWPGNPTADTLSGVPMLVDYVRVLYSYPGGTPIFSDVSYGYWARDWIERLYNHGVTGGCSATPLMYCPEATVTRAQMAVFLLVAEHGTGYTPPPASGLFNDVPADNGFAKWIEQLYNEGITGGCGGGNYCPNQAVTREQMAVFLLVAEHGSGYTPPAASGVFNDVPADNPFAPWVEQLAAEGITGGCGGGNFCPKGTVTRAQMAVFLVAAFNLP